MCIAAGVKARGLMAYLGHSSIQMTFDRYGHLMPGNEDEAAELLNAYLRAAAGRRRRRSREHRLWGKRGGVPRPP
ncbi:MAG TPA: hypothetical protein PKD59_13150 [Miltoncostaeaceae bacterium]|nr:hypothetical protein [Miltoncostaeaceae bacterium]